MVKLLLFAMSFNLNLYQQIVGGVKKPLDGLLQGSRSAQLINPNCVNNSALLENLRKVLIPISLQSWLSVIRNIFIKSAGLTRHELPAQIAVFKGLGHRDPWCIRIFVQLDLQGLQLGYSSSTQRLDRID